MLPPTVKQFFFKLLISIFVHDYKNVLRQYRQAYNDSTSNGTIFKSHHTRRLIR